MTNQTTPAIEEPTLTVPVEAIVMPLIRCSCRCGKIWDVAFVPWTFAPENAFKCLACKQWCKKVQLFCDGDAAPAINILPSA